MKRGKENNRVFASEKKYRAKLVKGKHGWLIKGMVFSALILGGAFATTSSVDASEWQANSVEQIASRIKPGQTSITMEFGDTVYNIGLAINIKDPMQLLFDNGFTHGEQYTLPVGTIISWDGNHVTVKDPDGNIIGDKIVSDDEKHDPSKTIAGQATDTPQNGGSNTSSTNGNKVPNTGQSNQGSVNTNQTNGQNGQGSTNGSNNQNTSSTPSEPNKPTDPTNPSEPTDPAKPVDPTEPTEPVDPSPSLTELEKLKQQLSDLQQKLVVAEQELASAVQELETAKNLIGTNLDDQITALQNEIAQKEAQQSAAQATVNETQSKVDNLTGEVATAQQKTASAQAEVDQWTSQVATAQQQVDAAQTEIDAATASGDDDALAAAQQKQAEAQSQLDSATANQLQKEAELALAQADQIAKQDQLATAQQELATAQDQLASNDTTADKQKLQELQDQKNKQDDIKNSIAELEKKVEEKQKVVDDLKNQIKETEKKIADIELKVTREQAVAQVNQLEYLTNDLKNGYISRINSSLSASEISSIVGEAQAKNAELKAQYEAEQAAKKLAEAKTSAKATIDSMNLTSDEKSSYKSKVDAVTTIEGVQSVVNEAQAKSDENDQKEEDAKKLAQAKKDAKTSIDSMNLTNDEKSSYQSKVDTATTIDGVQAVVNEAQAKSDENDQKEEDAKKLAEAKKNAKTQIDSMNLTSEEKSSYSDEIDAVTEIAGIQLVIDKAQAKSDENDAKEQDAKKLAEAKEKAITKINSMNLKDQKQSFVDQINAAQSESVVDRIVEDAQKVSDKNDQDEQDAKELATAKTNALAKLEKMNLKDQLESFKSQVNNATTVKQVNDIIGAAQTVSDENDGNDQDAKELAEAKATALGQIDKMNLKDQKQSFVDRVNSAKTKAEVTKVVEDAQNVSDANDQKDQDEKDLVKAKETALAQLESMNLKDQKQSFISQVNSAKTVADVLQVVKDAQKVSDENDQKDADAKELAKAKETALTKLDGMNLKDKLSEFKSKVNAATSTSAIDQIVKDAQKISDENDQKDADAKALAEAKETAKTTIKGFGLDDEASYLARVDSAKTIDEVNAIVKEAEANKPKTIDEMKKEMRQYVVDNFTDQYRKLKYQMEAASIKTKEDYEAFKEKIERIVAADKLSESEQTKYVNDRLTEMVNDYRKENGSVEMANNDVLQHAADIRAKELAELFDHDRPDGSGYQTALWQAERETGQKLPTSNGHGENIAETGYTGMNAEEAILSAFDAWQKSEGHDKNMLNNGFKYVAFSAFKVGNTWYVVTLFLSAK